MSKLHDVDDAQAAVIDQRIGQGFAFLRDVLAHPALTEQIPTGATLRHRDVALDREPIVVRLTAYQAPAMATWAALVSGIEGAPPQWAHVGTWHAHDSTAWHLHPRNGQRVTFDATGETVTLTAQSLASVTRA